MKKWTGVLLVVLLFVTLTVPTLADDGGGQVIFPGENVVIEPGEQWAGDLTLLGGNLELREGGRVLGDVAVLGGNAIVDGAVEGNLVVIGGTLDLRSNAVIDQDLVTFGAAVSRAEGAIVRGQRVEGLQWNTPQIRILPSLPLQRWDGSSWSWQWNSFFDLMSRLLRTVLNVVALIVFGALLVLLLPKNSEMVIKTVSEAPLPSLGVGLLSGVVLAIVVPLLIIICIGIPIAILVVMAAVAAGVFGWVSVGTLVGGRILRALNASRGQPLLEVVIGVAAITLLAEVPCLGWLLALVVGAVGLGAVVLTRFGTMAYERVRVASPMPPAPPAAPEEPASSAE